MNSVPLSITGLRLVRILLSSFHIVLCKQISVTLRYRIDCYLVFNASTVTNVYVIFSEEGDRGPFVSNESL